MSQKTKPKFQSTTAREKFDRELSAATKLKLKLKRAGGYLELSRIIGEDKVKCNQIANDEDVMGVTCDMGR